MEDNGNLLALLESLSLPSIEEVAEKIASDFRKRRIEKGMTREYVALQSGVPLASISRFEQKGLISLHSLIRLAIALNYLAEIRDIFKKSKFSTMAELEQIKRNQGKKKAYPSKKNPDNDEN